MIKTIEQQIQCQYCRSSLNLIKKYTQSEAVFKCSCNSYLLISGILYLKNKTYLNQAIFDYLDKGKINQAIESLFSPSYSHRLIFNLILKYSFLCKLLGFQRLMILFKYISRKKSWFEYLRNRERIPSFFFGLLSLDLIKNRNQTIVDIGCGAGNLLPFIAKRVKAKNVLAVDQSFFNLYLARLIFAKKESLLICVDLENGLPFKTESINLFLMLDMIYDIKKRGLLLKEIKRTSAKHASLAILQSLNRSPTAIRAGIQGLNPYQLIRELKIVGLKNYACMSNQLIWRYLNTGNRLPLVNDDNLKGSYAYNIFASTQALPDFLFLKKPYLDLLRKTKINLYQDNDLI